MLDIDIAMLLLTAAVFLFLLCMLNKILYKPLLGFMERREGSINSDLQATQKNGNDITSLEEEATGILAEARAKASKMKEDALSAIKIESTEKVDQKIGELEKEYDGFLTTLEESKTELKNTLLSQMPLLKEGIKMKLSQI